MPLSDGPDEISFAATALDRLLARIGVNRRDTGGAIRFTGTDPVVQSRLRYGAATASALAAQGAAVAAIWRQRSGRGQDVSVSLPRAVLHGLRTVFELRQNGHGFVVGSPGASQFYRTADGRHLYCVRNPDYPHLAPNLLGFLRCANTPEAIAKAIGGWHSGELEEAMAESRLPAVMVRSPDEWSAHPQGRWLLKRPGVEIERIGDSPAEPLGPAPRPLSGIRVLDASHVIAGPATARSLAEQGASVLHVSAPHQPDPIQMMMDLGLGKRAAYIDLNRVEDARRLRELAGQSDIFVESWRPGALARRGFSPRDLAALRPGIIYVSVSCYGAEGPWASRAGYEPIGQAVCGLSATEGSLVAPRNAPTVTMNDYLSAYLAAAGALGALLRRSREGGSYHVRTSLTQASMWVLGCGLLPEAVSRIPIMQNAELPAHQTMQSAFGEIRHVPCVTEYSETRAYWELPPEPFGGARPAWW